MGRKTALKKLVLSVLGALPYLFFPIRVFAQGEIIEGAPTLGYLETIFTNVVSAVLSLAGIVLFVMLLFGGFRYLTSGGDPKALEAAKGTLTHAILGLVVLLFAFFVLRLIHAITGVDVTIFRVITN